MILEETAKRVLREETGLDLETLRTAVKNAEKGSDLWFEAVHAYQVAKERAGIAQVVKNPDIDYSLRENKRRKTVRTNIDRLYRTKGNMIMKRELAKEARRKARERKQQQLNEFGVF